MRLRALAAAVPGARVMGDGEVDVAAITHDSREVTPGALFLAVRGERHDGHLFAADAVAQGAAAIAVEQPLHVGVPQVVVPSMREAMPHLAAAFYGHPSREVEVIGVTGTSGKGAVTYLARAVLEAGGVSCGVIGTTGAIIGGRLEDLSRTTPEAPALQALLARMRDAGMRAVAVEVASHALAMHRVDGTRFRAAAFTNLTQDHLDFHGTMEAYRAVKASLFERVDPSGVAVVNRDDPHGAFMAARSRAPVLTYGLGESGDVRADEVELSLRGCAFEAITPRGRRRFSIPITGRFNVSNALCAIALGVFYGVPLDAMADALRGFPGIPGRFELVDEGQAFAVVVDYSHKPDGLEKVLRTAREIAPGRVLAVFGCGGDRDRGKRPMMGRIAVEVADHTVVTSDNPRSEDPLAIIREIVAGIEEVERASYEVEPDRRAAIRAAIAMARPGDIVMICGKGHETYQILRDGTIHFDDREEARAALRGLGTGDSGLGNGASDRDVDDRASGGDVRSGAHG